MFPYRFLNKWRAAPPVYAVDSTKAENWSEVRMVHVLSKGDNMVTYGPYGPYVLRVFDRMELFLCFGNSIFVKR